MEGMQAYGAGKAGGAFDPVTFLQQPQTILRIVSWVNRAEEKLSGPKVDPKFEESFHSEQKGSLCRPAKLHVTAVTMVMRPRCPSFRPGNSFTRRRRDRVSAGNSLEHSLLL
ncbi:hypothetical protein ILYODFUR_014712 [Ilyodon furcidens]|uniref:Uncharacterized protein n=1 Tax=Ilyodon furcidens TaxID=33524 RepID=A0ABV0U878_9TELE